MELFDSIFEKQQNVEAVPSNQEITEWAVKVLELLFPEQKNNRFISVKNIQDYADELEIDLVSLLKRTQFCSHCDLKKVATQFFKSLPEIYRLLNTDIKAILEGDPAANNEFEVIRTYPGFFAISFYRIAHFLLNLEVPLIPRILTEFAHSKTGIDIHPGAKIGECFFIDHGTGIVIGESSQIGKSVKFYQGVTLGALSVHKDMAHKKRHPTIEDHVVIYSGATILGGNTLIGSYSIIGGNVWITESVPPHSKVYHIAGIEVSALESN